MCLCFRLGNRPWRICSQTCVMDDACWSCWRGCQDTRWYERAHTHTHTYAQTQGHAVLTGTNTHTSTNREDKPEARVMPDFELSVIKSLETKIRCRWSDVWTVFFKQNSGPIGMVWPDSLLFYICSYRGSINNGTTWKPKRARYLRRESQRLKKWY